MSILSSKLEEVFNKSAKDNSGPELKDDKKFKLPKFTSQKGPPKNNNLKDHEKYYQKQVDSFDKKEEMAKKYPKGKYEKSSASYLKTAGFKLYAICKQAAATPGMDTIEKAKNMAAPTYGPTGLDSNTIAKSNVPSNIGKAPNSNYNSKVTPGNASKAKGTNVLSGLDTGGSNYNADMEKSIS